MLQKFLDSLYKTREYLKSLSLSRLVLLIALSSYFLALLFFFLFNGTSVEERVWSSVPNEAFAILKFEDQKTLRHSIEQEPVAELLKNTPDAYSFFELLDYVDSLTDGDDLLEDVLYSQPFWVSLHMSSKNALNYMFYIPLKKDLEQFDEVVDSLWVPDHIRSYKTYEVSEVTLPFGSIYHTIINDVLVISASGILIDDAIRHQHLAYFEKRQWRHFREKFHRKRFQSNNLTVYWNYKAATSLWNSLGLVSDEFDWAAELGNVLEASSATVSLEDAQINAFGKILKNKHSESLYEELWSGQEATTSRALNYLPSNTAFYSKVGYSDSPSFWEVAQSEQSRTVLDDILSSVDLSSEDLQDHLEGEVVWANALFERGEFQYKWLLFETKDTDRLQEDLKEISQGLTIDSVRTTMSFTHHEIIEMPIPDFVNLFVDGLPLHVLSAFPEKSFFTHVDGYWVVANSEQAVLAILRSIALKDVIGGRIKSGHKQLLEGLSHDIHFGQPAYLQAFLQQKLLANWNRALWPYRKQFTDWKYMAMSINWETENWDFLSEASILGRHLVMDSVAKQEVVPYDINLPAPLHTQPKFFRISNQEVGVLFQDRWKRMSLLDKEGLRLWIEPINSLTSSLLVETSRRKSSLSNLMLSSGNQVFMFGPEGANIAFPILASSTSIQTFNAFLPKGDLNFACSDRYGNIYLFNQYNQLRIGWNPKKLDSELAVPLRIVPSEDEVFYVALEKAGVLHVFDQFGRAEAGFPLSLGERVEDFVVPSLADSLHFIYLLTAQGNLMQVSSEGVVKKTISLPRTRSDAKFSICHDERGQGGKWLIARQEGKQVSVFNKEGMRLFDRQFESDELKDVQYFYFNANQKAVVITSRKMKESWLLHEDGTVVNEVPFNSDHPVDIYQASENGFYFITYVLKNRLKVERLDW